MCQPQSKSLINNQLIWHNLINKVSLDYPLEEESSDPVFLTNNLDPNSEPNPKMAATDHTAVELSYCSVKNGVNDMLDYIALGTIHILRNYILGERGFIISQSLLLIPLSCEH